MTSTPSCRAALAKPSKSPVYPKSVPPTPRFQNNEAKGRAMRRPHPTDPGARQPPARSRRLPRSEGAPLPEGVTPPSQWASGPAPRVTAPARTKPHGRGARPHPAAARPVCHPRRRRRRGAAVSAAGS